MQNPFKSWDNVYTITYQVYSYSPFKWEECPSMGYITEPGTYWKKRVKRLAIGEICFVSYPSPTSNFIFITRIYRESYILQNTLNS